MMVQQWGQWTAGLGFIGVILLLAATGNAAYQVGYLEGGEYWTYTQTFEAMRRELDQRGWGQRIHYPSDARFSPGWEPEKQAELSQRARQLMARNDLDLIIAAGTAATEALLGCNNGRTPLMAMAVADPIKSGFVASETDSGVDNFTVRIVPGRYKRMFEIFHAEVGFSKLGLIYHDSENGRKYANVEDAYEVAQEQGFTILPYKQISRAEKNDECLEGIRALLAAGMDAFFIPTLVCFDWRQSDVGRLLAVLAANNIPTFAREGSRFVQAGALMGFSTYDFSDRGRFFAERAIRILTGTSPRSLPMVDNAMPKISLNLRAAEQIGFDLSFDILRASDEVYHNIILPDDRLVK